MCEQSRISSWKYLTWQTCDLRWIVTKVNQHIFSKCILTLSFAKPFFFLPLCYLTLLPHRRHAGQEPTPRCYSPCLRCTTPKHKGDASVLSHTLFPEKEVQVVGRNVTIAIIDSLLFVKTRGKLVLTSKMGINSEQILISSEWWKRAQVKGANQGNYGCCYVREDGRRSSNSPGCQAVQLHADVAMYTNPVCGTRCWVA